MRRKDVKPKDRRKVPIPDELRESLREVHEFLRETKRGDDSPIDFDDAIQIGRVCGGQVGTDARPYVFAFYPSDDKRRGMWYLTLDSTEIEDIGDGRMTEITMFCCTSPDCRTKFREPDEDCFYCDLEDDEETKAFQTQLTQLAASVTSKEEWVSGYVAIKPNASGMEMIGDYNSIENLGGRLGWFTFSEAQEMIQKAQSKPN